MIVLFEDCYVLVLFVDYVFVGCDSVGVEDVVGELMIVW